MSKIGFIGIGNMGGAMLEGCLPKFDISELTFYDKDTVKVQNMSQKTSIVASHSGIDCVNDVKYVVLAVKPQFLESVMNEIKSAITDNHIIISIIAGTPIKKIKDLIGKEVRVVRAMPNTPALIGEGMTGVSYNESEYNDEEKKIINDIFSSIGRMKVVDENLMSAVVCACGSSPAYVYMFIEALADGVVKCGMPRKDAYEFVAQTVLGSAKMVLESGIHPAELKDMVCSPAGTTIEAVAKLEECGFRNSIIEATKACYEKSESLAK